MSSVANFKNHFFHHAFLICCIIQYFIAIKELKRDLIKALFHLHVMQHKKYFVIPQEVFSAVLVNLWLSKQDN